MSKLTAGITFEELLQYIELKMKMSMCSYDNIEKCTPGTSRSNVIKIGEVLKDRYSNGYYVVVDVQLAKDINCIKGFGMRIQPSGDTFEITEGGTHFGIDFISDYIERKTGLTIFDLIKKQKNKKVMEEINALEAKIAELQKQLV